MFTRSCCDDVVTKSGDSIFTQIKAEFTPKINSLERRVFTLYGNGRWRKISIQFDEAILNSILTCRKRLRCGVSTSEHFFVFNYRTLIMTIN